MRGSFASIVLRAHDSAKPGRDERRRTFAWARRTGFDGVELSPLWLETDPLTPTSLRTLRAEFAAEDLVVSGLNLNRVVLTRSPDGGAHRERIARGIEAASWLGAHVVTSSSAPCQHRRRSEHTGPHLRSAGDRGSGAGLGAGPQSEPGALLTLRAKGFLEATRQTKRKP